MPAPRSFLSTGYRVKIGDKSEHDHWSGGQPQHRGAKCPTCEIPLLLLWDINCNDPRLPRKKFGPLKRLPLYFCWSCVSDVAYQIVEEHHIVIHTERSECETGHPYEPYPEFFQRKGLTFLDVQEPTSIQRINNELETRWRSARGDDPIPLPTETQSKLLKEFYGHPADLPMSQFHHQFGGEPMRQSWAFDEFDCPNPSCKGSLVNRVLGRKSKMKFLAGVLNDPWTGLPMAEPANESNRENWNCFVSVQFHICDCCWTILGLNRGG